MLSEQVKGCGGDQAIHEGGAGRQTVAAPDLKHITWTPAILSRHWLNRDRLEQDEFLVSELADDSRGGGSRIRGHIQESVWEMKESLSTSVAQCIPSAPQIYSTNLWIPYCLPNRPSLLLCHTSMKLLFLPASFLLFR